MSTMKYVVAVIVLVSTVPNLGRKSAPILKLNSMRSQRLKVFAKLEHFQRLLIFAEILKALMRGFVHLWRLKIVAQKARDANMIMNLFGLAHMMGIHVNRTMSVVDHV